MKNYQEWKNHAANIELSNQAYINGKFVDAASGETFESINPTTQQCITSIAACSNIEVDQAVTSARDAYNSGVWSRRSAAQRKVVLLRLARLIEEHSDELALIDTLDMGKPIAETSGFDLPSTVDLFQWTAESIDKIYGEIAPTAEDALALIRREPIGVVAAITPWNYPLMMASWKVAPALAAGNSIILKPSEKSSLSALRLAQLATEAGVPDGVFNVITGFGHTAGKALALHSDVDVLVFTGSTSVGKLLLQYAGQSNMKQVWLETGGKSPAVVFADCPSIETAAQGVALGILNNQGETCIATSRLLIEDSIKAPFLEQLAKEIKQVVTGDPLNPETSMGPLVDKAHYDNVQRYIDIGKSEAGEPMLGSEIPDGTGYFITPAVFTNTHSSMRIVKEEIFGPVLAVDTFSSYGEAMQKANDSIYGLGAGVWTTDLVKAHRASRDLQAGMVWINNWGGGNATTPFGGVKQSGNGRDKSMHAIEKYSELKSTWLQF